MDPNPYAGDLVFTAFSGSHQDAIRKGLTALADSGSSHWEVPYLPIDPVDVGRTYEAVIRINSQSGKGGVAYLLERDRGFYLPRRQQVEFSQIVQGIVEQTGRELSSDEIGDVFEREYLSEAGAFSLREHREGVETGTESRDPTGQTKREDDTGRRSVSAVVSHDGVDHAVSGFGNGPIDAFVDGMSRHFGLGVRVSDYREHAVGQGADAVAVAYVEVVCGESEAFFGVGRDSDIVTASLRAVVSAVNRAAQRRAADAA